MTKRYSPKYKRFYNDQYYFKDHEYKPSRRQFYTVKRTDPLRYLSRRMNMLKQMEHDMYVNGVCESGFTRGQGYGGLYRAWQAFIIRKEDDDREGMEHYARAIRTIQQDIKVKMSQFPQLKLMTIEYLKDPENRDLLEEEAMAQNKDPDDLSSEDVLNVMMQQDKLAYEMAGMQYY